MNTDGNKDTSNHTHDSESDWSFVTHLRLQSMGHLPEWLHMVRGVLAYHKLMKSCCDLPGSQPNHALEWVYKDITKMEEIHGPYFNKHYFGVLFVAVNKGNVLPLAHSWENYTFIHDLMISLGVDATELVSQSRCISAKTCSGIGAAIKAVVNGERKFPLPSHLCWLFGIDEKDPWRKGCSSKTRWLDMALAWGKFSEAGGTHIHINPYSEFYFDACLGHLNDGPANYSSPAVFGPGETSDSRARKSD